MVAAWAETVQKKFQASQWLLGDIMNITPTGKLIVGLTIVEGGWEV